MSGPVEDVGFHGVLGGFDVLEGNAVLRLHPDYMPRDISASEVFTVTMDRPQFTEADISPLIDTEVDVAVFPDRAELFHFMAGEMITLRASVITTAFTPYHARDVARLYQQMSANYDRLNDRMSLALQKDRKGRALVEELIRRAEIKAAASDDLQMRQASALAVLERLMTLRRGRLALALVHPRLSDLQPVLAR